MYLILVETFRAIKFHNSTYFELFLCNFRMNSERKDSGTGAIKSVKTFLLLSLFTTASNCLSKEMSERKLFCRLPFHLVSVRFASDVPEFMMFMCSGGILNVI